MITTPRIIIAGTHSSVGKSSITLALVAALRQRGLKVQTFKVGPDYLDPGHLSRVSGRPCYNLDGWMGDESYVRQLVARSCPTADIALIEGVMGLFDGSSPDSLQGSTAQIATWLNAPVLLVVNAHGMARSIAALVKGYATFEPGVKIAAVVANMCGSANHGQLLERALQAASLPPLVGTIPRGALPPLPSRHLGLVSASETAWNDELIAQLSKAATDHLDLDRLLALATTAAPLPSNSPTLPAPVPMAVNGDGLRIAIARDNAFQFYYPDLFAAFEQRGIELCFFSPLNDNCLPARCDALYLGGGYPEIHAESLSRNTAMLQSIRDFCSSDRPVYAECGGLIYLCQGVTHANHDWPLTAILPSWVRMLDKRKALGYVAVTLTQPCLFGERGTKLRGHEFHYSQLCSDPIGVDGWQSAYCLKQNRSGQCHSEGYQKGQILASYAHLHLAAQPKAIETFIQRIWAGKNNPDK